MDTNLPINKVRDPEFAVIDDYRAASALYKIVESSNGITEDCELNDAECSMVIAMMQSQEYFKYINEKVEKRFDEESKNASEENPQG